MPIRAYNVLISQIGAGYWLQQPLWGEVANTPIIMGGNNLQIVRLGETKALPNPLPTDVTAYLVTRISAAQSSAGSLLLGKLINLGSLDISGASGTFTDGSAMPTITELGTSNITASAVFVEVTTALSGAPGSFTITYVDQDGNAAETTTAQALGASAPVRSGGWVVLNSPDWGARDITAAARSGGTTPTGTIKFWGMIPLTILPGTTSNVVWSENLLTGTFSLPRLGAGDMIGGFVFNNNTQAIVGDVFVVGDN